MHEAINFIKKEGWLLAYCILFSTGIFAIAICLDITNVGFWISLIFINLVKDCGEFKAFTEFLEETDEEIKKAGGMSAIFKYLFLGLLALYFIALSIFPTGFLSNAPLREGIPFSAGQFYLGLSIFSILIHYTSYKMTWRKEYLTEKINAKTPVNKQDGTTKEKDIMHIYDSIKTQFTEDAAQCAKEWAGMNITFEKTAKKTEYPLMYKCLEESNETILFFPDFPEFITIITSMEKTNIIDNAREALQESIKIYKANNKMLPWASEEKSIKELTGIDNIILISSTGGNNE